LKDIKPTYIMNAIPKGAIIYRSKYGSTHQYAEWLSERLDLPVFDPTTITPQQLAGYDYFLIGSPIYIGKMLIRKWLEKHREPLTGKKIFLFIVCGTPVSQKEKIQQIAEANIPRWLIRKEDVFFVPGRVIMRKLSFLDRLLLKMGARAEKDPQIRAGMQKDSDRTSPSYLKEIIAAAEKFQQVPDHSQVTA